MLAIIAPIKNIEIFCNSREEDKSRKKWKPEQIKGGPQQRPPGKEEVLWGGLLPYDNGR